MKAKRKRWSEMTTEELAKATKQFDDPNYDPRARKPTERQLKQLNKVQRKSAKERLRIALSLEQGLIEDADEYAAIHGITFSDLVSDALRRVIQKKSA
ncbi:MAG TPA: hypothetical protein VHD56_05815 [Tepidisphaeraceae bacterium]|nr:hypothetical protein [Tepidisphaeraceae bacterium]